MVKPSLSIGEYPKFKIDLFNCYTQPSTCLCDMTSRHPQRYKPKMAKIIYFAQMCSFFGNLKLSAKSLIIASISETWLESSVVCYLFLS